MMNRRSRPPLGMFASYVLLAALAALAGASPAFAQSESPPWWQLSSGSTPTYLSPGHKGQIAVAALNVGDANVQGAGHPVTFTDNLPPGLTAVGVEARKSPQHYTVVANPPCTLSASSVSCTFKETLAPFEQWEMYIQVQVAAGLPSGSTNAPNESEVNEVKIEGGEALPKEPLRRALKVSEEETPFGVESYELAAENAKGEPEAQAGSHPFQFSTSLTLNSINYKFPGKEVPIPSVPALVKNLHVNLPAGLIGNTLALPQCTELEFTTVVYNLDTQCPPATAVGAAIATVVEPLEVGIRTAPVPVFNLVPSVGEPARFGFVAYGVPVTLDTVVRGGDYHVVVSANNISQDAAVLSSEVTIWGVPGDPSHNRSRGSACLARGVDVATINPLPKCEEPEPGEQNTAPFLTLPTSCTGPLQTTVEAESWLPGASFLAPVAPSFTESLEGCGQLPFSPEVSVKPREQQSNTPTGLLVDLKVPQTTTLEEGGLAEADVRDTTVTLPVGVQLSPSAADGLAACSLAQIGFTGVNAQTHTDEFTSNPATCPDASKVGTVQIKTPVLKQVLQGSVYIAAQSENPFGSLFGMYIVVEDPVSGVLVKLAGKVTVDVNTGQVTSTFANAPQLPFEDFKLELFNGPRASLATPRSCGGYATQASFTPWSGTPAVETSLNPEEFNITSGPHGTPCSNPQPLNLGFQAGTTSNQAGAFTPFTLTITRPDTDQALKSVSMTLPPGLAGMLSKVKQCPEPQAEQGTCGPESLIGRATASAGLGGDPFTETGGRVYITGPYHGAPFGLSVVIPAVAGPFNFGNVVTRSTINVDPSTAAITVNSDLATMLNTTTTQTGIPVQLRRVDVTIERPGGEPFQFNPTNCTPMKITGTLTGDQGASAAVSTPFQVANCDKLPFAPKLTATAGAQASKVNGENLNVKIESQGLGQANIAKVALTIPQVLPSRLSTIQKACVLAVFEANPAACDEGSVIGKATIHTPVLTSSLSGPAYLVSHGGAAFPDVEFVLQGEGITLILDGKTDIKKGITYSRFESSPDAPFTTFETELPTGPHSALTAYVPASENYNLCKTSLVMPTVITGQNGAVISQNTKIAVTGCAGVLSFKASRAQLLAKALKACRKKYKHSKHKRVACEKQAHKKYGAKAVKKKTKAVKKKK